MSSIRTADLHALAKILSDAVNHINRMCNVSSNPVKASHGHLYKSSGRLNDSGVRRINELFDAGHSKAEVAREMGITFRAAQLRYNAWASAKQNLAESVAVTGTRRVRQTAVAKLPKAA